MTSRYHPDPHPAVETARQAYLGVRATADRQLEAMGGIAEVGTDAGDRYAALGHWAADAYMQYVDAWAEANPLPEAAADAAAKADGEAERTTWKADLEASQEWDRWEWDREYLADPTQPEYYEAYERQYGEPAPDWPSITGLHPLPEFEAGIGDPEPEP